MLKNGSRLKSLIGNENAELIHGHESYTLSIESSPPCTRYCPAGINVKSYVNLIANKKFEEALELIRIANPFPGICGRVCTHPCEANCQRSEIDDSLSIKALKRFVADYEISRKVEKIEQFPVQFEEKIAVIGSGPAGLTTALDLVKLGYRVTVFEALDTAGGMMSWGIPEFRLPRGVIDREIGIIRSMGVQLEMGRRIVDPATLFNEGYDAILIAIGSWKGLPLNIEGEQNEGVIDCLEFLRTAYRGDIDTITGKVVVIGGGDSAMDASRVAVRLGASSVTIAYRRTENEMPAERSEVQEAIDEGILIETLLIPKRIIGDTSVTGVEFIKAKLGEPDESGRRRPIPIPCTEIIYDCDLLIPAISARPDVQEFAKSGISISSRGLIAVNRSFTTSREGIFAIGDAVSGPATIVEAIGKAHDCSRSIHMYLRSGETSTPGIEAQEIAGAVLKIDEPQPIPGYPVQKRSAEQRLSPGGESSGLKDFPEVEVCYSDFMARTEASRCNRCGPCEECRVCLPSCPDKQLLASFKGKDFLLKVPVSISRTIHGSEGSDDYESIYDTPDDVTNAITYAPSTDIPDEDSNDISNDIPDDLSTDIPDEDSNDISNDIPDDLSTDISDDPSTDIPGEHSDVWKIRSNNTESPVELYSLTPKVDQSLCIACGRCEGACAYRAIRINLKAGGVAFSSVDHDVCRSCGRCVLVCPSGALSLELYCDTRLTEGIQRSIETNDGIAVFGCHWSAWSSPDVDENGIVEFMCSIGLTPAVIISAFGHGARGVLIFQCGSAHEHYLGLTYNLDDIVRHTRKLLEASGIDSDRILISTSSGNSQQILDGFSMHLQTKGLDRYQSIGEKIQHISGRIGKMREILYSMNEQECTKPSGEPYLNAISLKSAGLPDTVETLENIKCLTNKCGVDIETMEIETRFIQPSEKYGHEKVSLMSLIMDTLPSLKFTNVATRVGLHTCNSKIDSRFIAQAREMIASIPGCEIINLSSNECGATEWKAPDASKRVAALKLFSEAERYNVDLIITLSLDCLTHLKICNLPGAWRFSQIEVMDIFTFILQSLKDGEIHE